MVENFVQKLKAIIETVMLPVLCIYVLSSSPIGVGDSATVWFEDRSSDCVTPVIPHDGSPYIFWGKKVWSCHFGVDKHQKDKERLREKKLSASCVSIWFCYFSS